jgi:lipopolysaccharide biosynthesis protein
VAKPKSDKYLKMQQQKLCILPHFFSENHIPYYVAIYVTELQKYFDKIIIATNKRAINNIQNIENEIVTVQYYDNNGYDFGLFYRALEQLNPTDYSRIACINDSNILLAPLQQIFDWASSCKPDCWGLIDSHNMPAFSTQPNSYHIQSHFLVFEQKAIPFLQKFLALNTSQQLLHQKSSKALKKSVINHWEIGLSQYFINEKLHLKSYISSEDFAKKHQLPMADNFTLKQPNLLLQIGLPTLKKRIITSIKAENIFRKELNWRYLLHHATLQNLDMQQLKTELWGLQKSYILGKIKKLFSK